MSIDILGFLLRVSRHAQGERRAFKSAAAFGRRFDWRTRELRSRSGRISRPAADDADADADDRNRRAAYQSGLCRTTSRISRCHAQIVHPSDRQGHPHQCPSELVPRRSRGQEHDDTRECTTAISWDIGDSFRSASHDAVVATLTVIGKHRDQGHRACGLDQWRPGVAPHQDRAHLQTIKDRSDLVATITTSLD